MVYMDERNLKLQHKLSQDRQVVKIGDDSTGLLLKDNRVFVEQNFQGGSTPVSPNNVLKNADMSQSQLVDSSFSQGSSDDLKRPINWFYVDSNSAWDWSSTDFIIRLFFLI